MAQTGLTIAVVAVVVGHLMLVHGGVDVTVFQKDSTANDEQKKVFLEVFEGQKNCASTGQIPQKPRSLSFCHKFNDEACCFPALDMEDNEMFDNFLDLGLSCRLRGDVRNHPMAKLYCMNCDPEQPQYVRDVPYFPTREGSPTELRNLTVLVCRDWATTSFGTNPVLGLFNRCGVLKSAPCLSADGTIIPDRDRYTCGDDLLVPGTEFGTDDDGNLWSADQAIEAFLNADSVGPPAMDEDFGFKLITNRPCNSTEGMESNPDCLRTEAQLTAIRNTTGTSCQSDSYFLDHPDECADFNDEKCFQGAADMVPRLWLLVVLVVVALLVSL